MKGLFLKMPKFRKFLVLLIIFLLVISWSLSLLKRHRRLKADLRAAREELMIQSQWIGKEEVVEKALEVLLKQVSAEKSYDKIKFVGFVDGVARSIVKSFSIDVPQTKSGDTFDSHSLKLKVDGADLGQLIKLEQAINEQHPYISIDEVKITANSSNPNKLNAQFSLVAIQLKKISKQ